MYQIQIHVQLLRSLLLLWKVWGTSNRFSSSSSGHIGSMSQSWYPSCCFFRYPKVSSRGLSKLLGKQASFLRPLTLCILSEQHKQHIYPNDRWERDYATKYLSISMKAVMIGNRDFLLNHLYITYPGTWHHGRLLLYLLIHWISNNCKQKCIFGKRIAIHPETP